MLTLVSVFLRSLQLTPEFTQRLNNKIRELLQQMERGLKAADPQDCTAYTGWAGRAAPRARRANGPPAQNGAG